MDFGFDFLVWKKNYLFPHVFLQGRSLLDASENVRVSKQVRLPHIKGCREKQNENTHSNQSIKADYLWQLASVLHWSIVPIEHNLSIPAEFSARYCECIIRFQSHLGRSIISNCQFYSMLYFYFFTAKRMSPNPHVKSCAHYKYSRMHGSFKGQYFGPQLIILDEMLSILVY